MLWWLVRLDLWRLTDAAAGARCRAAPVAGAAARGAASTGGGWCPQNSQLNVGLRDIYLSRRARGPGESSPDACEHFLSAALA